MWLLRKKQDDSTQGPPPSKLRIATIQVLATIVANLPAISPGMSIGFSAVALPRMQQEATLDTEELSWIASSASAAAPIGCLMAGYLCERLGRRGTLIVVNLPCFVGWLLIALVPTTEDKDLPLGSGSMAQLIAGRVLTGLATGMASSPSPVMISEISSPKLRGMLVCWNSVAIALGVLIIYLMGAFMPWRIAAGASAVIPILSAVLLVTVPESPIWLLTKGRVEKAREALTFYRAGHTAMVEAEFSQALEAAAQKSRATIRRRSSTISTSFASRSNSFLAAILRPEVYKPFLILNGYFLFQQLSGTFVVTFYAVDIVLDAGVKGIDPFVATVFIGFVRLAVCIGVSLGMKRLGRRAPSIISGAGMTVCMAAMAIYSTMKTNDDLIPGDDPAIAAAELGLNLTENAGGGGGMSIPADAWLPTIALLGFIAMGTLGFLTLPWAMMGEVFPTSVRGPASGLTSAIAYLVSFGVLKAYPGVAVSIGAHGSFFLFGIFSLLGTIFVTLWLPETQGRKLSEVERDFVDGQWLQLCRRTRFTEKKRFNSPEASRVIESNADVEASRELVNVVEFSELRNDGGAEQALETDNLRRNEQADEELRGKLDG